MKPICGFIDADTKESWQNFQLTYQNCFPCGAKNVPSSIKAGYSGEPAFPFPQPGNKLFTMAFKKCVSACVCACTHCVCVCACVGGRGRVTHCKFVPIHRPMHPHCTGQHSCASSDLITKCSHAPPRYLGCWLSTWSFAGTIVPWPDFVNTKAEGVTKSPFQHTLILYLQFILWIYWQCRYKAPPSVVWSQTLLFGSG